MPSREVVWHAGRSALIALEREWDALAAQSTMPYTSTQWLLAWLDAFAPEKRLVICTVWEGSALVAGLPLLRSSSGRLTAPCNYHSPQFRPVTRDTPSAEALVEAVLDATPTALEIRALPCDDAFLTALRAAALRRGLSLLVEPEHVSPVVNLRGGFEAYRSAVGSRLKEYERRRRKAIREHDTEFVLVARPEDLEHQVEAGLRLEAAGWKGRGGSAILSRPQTEAFYRDVVRRFDARQQLRISALWIDGELAAFDLALLVHDRYHLLKTAYDERHRSLAPGMVLRIAVVERCFELGLSAHEFLGPDMSWKRVFTDEDRPHCAVRVYGRGVGSRAALAYRKQLRPRLRSGYRAVGRWRAGAVG